MYRNVIESVLTGTFSFLLIFFTYVIPLLFSIRTIHNRDEESYTQWLTYWLLVYLLSPLFNTILHAYKLFNLSFILWLSLPRFQGASVIYNELVDTFLDRYHVEQKVDHKISTMKKSAKDAFWNIAKDIGWGILYQVGGIVSFVQDSAASLVENTTSNINVIVPPRADNSHDHNSYCAGLDNMDDGDGSHVTVRDNNRASEDNNGENVVHDYSNNDIDMRSAEEKLNNFDSDNNFQSSSIQSQSNDSHRHPRSSPPPSKSIRKSQPIHSVLESYSSLSSLEADTALIEKEKYIQDFTCMLKKGLYVFSWCTNSTVINHSSGASSVNITTSKHGERASKKYQLRVFKLVESINRNTSNVKEGSNNIRDKIQTFVLNPVESMIEEEGIDIFSFAVSDISGVRESRRGIQFMTSVSKLCQDMGNTTTNTVDGNREELVAEIVLSDGQDKDILLFGLTIFLSRCSSKSNNSLEPSLGVGDSKNTSKTMIRNNSFDTIDMNSSRSS